MFITRWYEYLQQDKAPRNKDVVDTLNSSCLSLINTNYTNPKMKINMKHTNSRPVCLRRCIRPSNFHPEKRAVARRTTWTATHQEVATPDRKTSRNEGDGRWWQVSQTCNVKRTKKNKTNAQTHVRLDGFTSKTLTLWRCRERWKWFSHPCFLGSHLWMSCP